MDPRPDTPTGTEALTARVRSSNTQVEITSVYQPVKSVQHSASPTRQGLLYVRERGLMPTWILHRGDALAVLPTLPDASVDLVLADPPYNSGGRTQSDRTKTSTRDKYVSGRGRKGAAHDLADFAGDNRDQRSFTAWLALVLAECLRVAQPGAGLLVFSDWRQLPATSDALQAGGWLWRGIIPWRKPISRPRLGGFRAECEYVLWGSAGPVDATRNPMYLPGWYSASQPRGKTRRHITQKPVELLAELVKVCVPAGTVLDPFAGSGSTGVAALESGRSFIGVEITDHYAAVAHARLSEVELDVDGSGQSDSSQITSVCQ